MSHIKKLTETKYGAWSMQIRSVLREPRLFANVEGSEGPPIHETTTGDQAAKQPAASTSALSPVYVTKLEAFELRHMKAICIILHSISYYLLMYVNNVDDPARA
jgi:hypothetical protein